jgi:tetratricopeptide (TPR) repeat protein
MADVFDIQDDIVEAIVKAIAPALVSDARTVVRRPTENLEAYEVYLKGRHHWHLRTPGTMQVAQLAFEEVIALDPGYALAYAGLADCLSIRRGWGWVSAAESCNRAREAATRAMALDPSLAEVHFTNALYIFFFEPQWRRAEAFLRQAVDINPRFAGAHAYLGMVSAADGRAVESTAHTHRARELDPLSAYVHYLAALAAFIGRRFTEAEHAARRALELQPDSLVGRYVLALALTAQERHEESVAALEYVVTLTHAGLCWCSRARIGPRRARGQGNVASRRAGGSSPPR